VPASNANRAFLLAGDQLSNRRRSSDGIHVLSKNLLDWRHIGRGRCFLVEHHVGHRRSSRFDNDRNSYRAHRAAVTGVTGDFPPGIKVCPVDGSHHLHHLAGGLLSLLVVLVERSLHVAKAAFHAQ